MESPEVLNRLFKAFSGTCVYRPLEVIIMLASLCVTLFMLASSPQVPPSVAAVAAKAALTLNNDQDDQDVPLYSSPSSNWQSPPPVANHAYSGSSNNNFVMFLRCLAFVCVLVQFKNLKKTNSKSILTFSILVTLISSVLFNKALLNWFNLEIPDSILLVIDVTIYSLVIIDLRNFNTILNNALGMATIKEAKRNIAHNFAHFVSKSTLDTLFLILLVALGNLSDSREIQTFSHFSCMLLASNFLIFITVYPALLSLILQLKQDIKTPKKKSDDKAIVNNASGATDSGADFELGGISTNPVSIYVKLMMTLFLIGIHLKLNFFGDKVAVASNERVETATATATEANKSSRRLSTLESSFSATQSGQIAFYIECCLLITLNLYILTKIFKHDEPTTPTTSSTATLAAAATAATTTSTSNGAIINTQPLSSPSSSSLPSKESPSRLDQTAAATSTVNDWSVSSTSSLTSMASSCSTLTAPKPPRTTQECVELLKQRQPQPILDDLSDEELIDLVKCKHIPVYKLESYFSDQTRGVQLRRQIIALKSESAAASMTSVPYENYDYSKVFGACCENVVGYVPVPLGIAGPLLVDGAYYQIPMATTEGTLIASTNRGCSALSMSNGVSTKVLSDGMTRGPVIKLSSAMRAAEVKEWLENDENFTSIKRVFDSTSRFAKLQSCKCCVVGRNLYVRFKSSTGDAMGMNMLSKGSEKALQELIKYFPDAQIVSLSGNYCTDKKSSAINWIEGRGKSVICEAIVKEDVVKRVLKTSVKALVDLNLTKNLVGSAMAGSIGGFNAHAANIVAAMFIACGQDPAQVVESSNCITWMECTGPNSEDLYISCSMPSLEVGTVGGGTVLDAQSACLKILGLNGSNIERPGENAAKLARIIAATVLAGELSLMSALASGHLVNSHMKYNRSALFATNQPNTTHNVL